MQSEDRLIHFSTELFHAPRQHPRPALQKLYFDLSQTRKAAYDSTDFTQPNAVRFYSRRPPKAQSIALFLHDRVVLVEEWADLSLGNFIEKIHEVARRGILDLGVPGFRAQTVTIRSTFALTHFDDARVFLLEHVCGQADRLTPHFRRPIETGGLRFAFRKPPPIAARLTLSSNHSAIVETKSSSKSRAFTPKLTSTSKPFVKLAKTSSPADDSSATASFPTSTNTMTPKEGLV